LLSLFHLCSLPFKFSFCDVFIFGFSGANNGGNDKDVEEKS
jgi:hypothetical protein